MEVDENFAYYHQYRRLVRRGAVKPLEHRCGTEMVSKYGSNDSFNLWCHNCDVTIEPGVSLTDRIEREVKKNFGEAND